MNWRSLANVGGTIVVLMGVAQRAAIAAELIAGGLDPATPVAIVERATRSDESSRRCRLDELGTLSARPPSTIVIGAVAAFDLRSSAAIAAVGSLDHSPSGADGGTSDLFEPGGS
jgi:siroheme synthase